MAAREVWDRPATFYPEHVTALRVLERAIDLAPGDHVSWAYDDVAGLRQACADTFTEGAARGEQLVYIGDRGHEELRDDLAGVDGRDALIENGRLRIHSIAELYHATGRFEPQAQVETFRSSNHPLRIGPTAMLGASTPSRNRRLAARNVAGSMSP